MVDGNSGKYVVVVFLMTRYPAYWTIPPPPSVYVTDKSLDPSS